MNTTEKAKEYIAEYRGNNSVAVRYPNDKPSWDYMVYLSDDHHGKLFVDAINECARRLADQQAAQAVADEKSRILKGIEEKRKTLMGYRVAKEALDEIAEVVRNEK